MQVIRTTTSTLLLLLLAACGGGEVNKSTAPAEPFGWRVVEHSVEDDGVESATAVDATAVTTAAEMDADFDRPRAAELEPHGDELGRFELTYYWIASETKRSPRQTTLYDKDCRPLARVSRSFARSAALEGTARLRDGRVLSIAGPCSCTRVCYFEATEDHRWGAGVAQRPLSPFRSVAVDPSRVAIGQTLYVPELDGLTMPGPAPYGGFVHDGCVIADDRGGNVRGKQLDFFIAKKSHYRSFIRRHKLTRVTTYDGGGRCESLAEGRPRTGRLAVHRNSI